MLEGVGLDLEYKQDKVITYNKLKAKKQYILDKQGLKASKSMNRLNTKRNNMTND